VIGARRKLEEEDWFWEGGGEGELVVGYGKKLCRCTCEYRAWVYFYMSFVGKCLFLCAACYGRTLGKTDCASEINDEYQPRKTDLQDIP